MALWAMTNSSSFEQAAKQLRVSRWAIFAATAENHVVNDARHDNSQRDLPQLRHLSPPRISCNVIRHRISRATATLHRCMSGAVHPPLERFAQPTLDSLGYAMSLQGALATPASCGWRSIRVDLRGHIPIHKNLPSTLCCHIITI